MNTKPSEQDRKLWEFYDTIDKLNSRNDTDLIQRLTWMALAQLNLAHKIGLIIFEKIQRASSNRKLVLLYVLDSITKNVGREYIDIFSEKLCISFVEAFRVADHRTKLDLYKLLLTWKPYFDEVILREIDKQLNFSAYENILSHEEKRILNSFKQKLPQTVKHHSRAPSHKEREKKKPKHIVEDPRKGLTNDTKKAFLENIPGLDTNSTPPPNTIPVQSRLAPQQHPQSQNNSQTNNDHFYQLLMGIFSTLQRHNTHSEAGGQINSRGSLRTEIPPNHPGTLENRRNPIPIVSAPPEDNPSVSFGYTTGNNAYNSEIYSQPQASYVGINDPRVNTFSRPIPGSGPGSTGYGINPVNVSQSMRMETSEQIQNIDLSQPMISTGMSGVYASTAPPIYSLNSGNGQFLEQPLNRIQAPTSTDITSGLCPVFGYCCKIHRENQNQIQFVPKSFKDPKSLLIRDDNAIVANYEEYQFTCQTCGITFTLLQRLRSHLDLHFRMKSQQRELRISTISRPFFPSKEKWEKSEENFQSFQKEGTISKNDINQTFLKYTYKQKECYLCRLRFELDKNQENNDWIIKNAVLVKISHPNSPNKSPKSSNTQFVLMHLKCYQLISREITHIEESKQSLFEEDKVSSLSEFHSELSKDAEQEETIPQDIQTLKLKTTPSLPIGIPNENINNEFINFFKKDFEKNFQRKRKAIVFTSI